VWIIVKRKIDMSRRYGLSDIADDLDERPVMTRDPVTGAVRIEPQSDYVGDSIYTQSQSGAIQGLQFGPDRRVAGTVRDVQNEDKRQIALREQKRTLNGFEQFVGSFDQQHPGGVIDQTRGDPRFAPYNIDADKAAHPLATMADLTYADDTGNDDFQIGPDTTRALFDAMMKSSQTRQTPPTRQAQQQQTRQAQQQSDEGRRSAATAPPGARAVAVRDVDERREFVQYAHGGTNAAGGDEFAYAEPSAAGNGAQTGYVPESFRQAPPGSAWRGVPSIDQALLPTVAPLNYYTQPAAEQVLDASRVQYNDHYNPGYGSSGPRQQLDTLRVHGRGKAVHVDEAAARASVPPNVGLGGPFDDLKSYDDEWLEYYSPAPNGGLTSNRFEGHALRSVQEESRDAAAASPATAGVAQAMNPYGLVPLGVVNDQQTGQSVQLLMNAPPPPDANYAESYSNGAGLETMYLRKLGLKWRPEDAPNPTNVVNRVPNGPDEDAGVARVRGDQTMRARLSRNLAQQYATSMHDEGAIHPVSKMYQHLEDMVPQNKLGPFGGAIVRNTPYAGPTRSGQDERIPGMTIQLDAPNEQDVSGRTVRASIILPDNKSGDWTSYINMDARTVAPGMQRTDMKQAYEREARTDRSGMKTEHTSHATPGGSFSGPAVAIQSTGAQVRATLDDGRGARNASGAVQNAHVSAATPQSTNMNLQSAGGAVRRAIATAGRGTRKADGVVQNGFVSRVAADVMNVPGTSRTLAPESRPDHAVHAGARGASAPSAGLVAPGLDADGARRAGFTESQPDHTTHQAHFSGPAATFVHLSTSNRTNGGEHSARRDHATRTNARFGQFAPTPDATMPGAGASGARRLGFTEARADHAVAPHNHAFATPTAGARDGMYAQQTATVLFPETDDSSDHVVETGRTNGTDIQLAHGGSRAAAATMMERDGASRTAVASMRVDTPEISMQARRDPRQEVGARASKPDVVLETAAGHGMLMHGDTQDARATSEAVHAQRMVDIKVSNASLLLGGGEAARQMSFADPANPLKSGKGANDPRVDRNMGRPIQKEPVRQHQSLQASRTQFNGPVSADAFRQAEASIQLVRNEQTGQTQTYFVRPWDLWRSGNVRKGPDGNYYIAARGQQAPEQKALSQADISDASSVMSAVASVANIAS